MAAPSSTLSAADLVQRVHGTTLWLLSAHYGSPFQGLQQAARKGRSNGLPLSLMKKLVHLDHAFNVVRHITIVSVDRLVKEVEEACIATNAVATPESVECVDDTTEAETAPSLSSVDSAVQTDTTLEKTAIISQAHFSQMITLQAAQELNSLASPESATYDTVDVADQVFISPPSTDVCDKQPVGDDYVCDTQDPAESSIASVGLDDFTRHPDYYLERHREVDANDDNTYDPAAFITDSVVFDDVTRHLDNDLERLRGVYERYDHNGKHLRKKWHSRQLRSTQPSHFTGRNLFFFFAHLDLVAHRGT